MRQREERGEKKKCPALISRGANLSEHMEKRREGAPSAWEALSAERLLLSLIE